LVSTGGNASQPGQVGEPGTPNPSALRHRQVAANGARFHVAEIGSGPLVLFLHGFPESWWAWRRQLPAVAAAGFQAAAMDLRGYGDSDKPPRGYDPFTLAADVAGVIRTLGAHDAVLVGQGWGGYVAWTVAAARPDCVRALCAVTAPHPLTLLRSVYRLGAGPGMVHLLAMQMPWLPERRIRRASYVQHHLSAWSAPGTAFPDAETIDTYRRALDAWPAPHCALEYHRWLVRSRLRADGRAFTSLMRRPLHLPVLQITGADDPVVPLRAVAGSVTRVDGDHQHIRLPHTGHFPHEEAPERFNRVLVDWLSPGTRPGVHPLR
jgi:pimeloyl-ACP methyl ester carboxylesterase